MDSISPGRLERALSHPRALPAILIFTLLLALPSIAIGFYADDYMFQLFLEKTFPNSPPWYDLYRFVPGDVAANRELIEGGAMPWWGHPELKIHLVRPLASAIMTAERWLFGSAPLGYHLFSIACYVALVAAVGRLFHKRLPGATGALAVLIFAVNETHLLPFGWISCQHMLLGALPVVLGLHAYLRYKEEGWRPGLWLGPLGLTLGLLSGETALCGVAYWVVYHLAGPLHDKSHGWQWWPRVAATLPVLGIGAYFIFYKVVGGGSAHNGAYFEPLSNPLGFARVALERLPVLLGNAILGVPADFSNAFPTGPLVALGVLSTVGLALLYRACLPAIPEGERAALRWLVPGAILSIFPSLGGFPGARLLLVPSIGFAALFAVILRHGFRRIEGAGAGRVALSLRRVGAGFLVLVHLILAAPQMAGGSFANAGIARKIESTARAAEIGPQARQRVFVAVASDPMVAIYPWLVIALDDPKALSCWSVLSMTKASHRITRTGPSSFRVAPIGRPMLQSSFEALYRSLDAPLHVGYEVHQCGATVRVTAVEGGKPSEIEVDLGAPLDDAGIVLLAWQDGQLRRVALGAVGEATELPWSPGPTGFF